MLVLVFVLVFVVEPALALELELCAADRAVPTLESELLLAAAAVAAWAAVFI